MRDFLKGLYQKKNFTKRLVTVILAVILMGFSLSWLVLVDMGTDPCTSLNLAVSGKFGMSLGNWQALFNCILFVFVILWGREYIGFGTLANMFLVGYSLDFFSWLWSRVLPAGAFESFGVRIAVLFPALALFVLVAAVYIDVELGTSPYDAIPFLVDKFQKKLSFRVVRCCYDLSVTVLAYLLGAHIGIVTILMGFTLGPVITWVGEKIRPLLGVESAEKA